MTKKILLGLATLALIALPFFVLAQVPVAQPSTCCVLGHDIDPYSAGDIVADPSLDPAVDSCWAKGVEHGPGTYTVDADWGGYCTMDTVYTVTDWIFWIFLAFVVIMGVITGFMFMTAGGDPAKIEKARGMIMYLVIGVVVAVIVKLIPALTRTIIGL